MKYIAIAALLLSSVAVGPVAARQVAAPAVQTEPSPQAVALTRRYLAAMRVDDSLKPMMNSMMSAMLDQQIKSRRDLTPEQQKLAQKAISDALVETLDAGMLDRIFEVMIPSIARVFSESELRAMVDFYESPVGQSIIGKMPAYGEASSAAVVAIMPEMQADLEKRIRKNLEAVFPPAN